jgi:hypothetical protein
MAQVIRKTDPAFAPIVTAFNLLRKQIGAGAFFHLDATERTVTFATLSGVDATAEAAAIAAANQVKAIYEYHLEDGVEGGPLAHKVVDTKPALVVATTLATAYTLANAIKADYNVHRASTTYHYAADATNVVAATDATTLATLQTLLNEIKTDLVAHMASAPVTGVSLRLVSA